MKTFSRGMTSTETIVILGSSGIEMLLFLIVSVQQRILNNSKLEYKKSGSYC